jgi:hypothetical protein
MAKASQTAVAQAAATVAQAANEPTTTEAVAVLAGEQGAKNLDWVRNSDGSWSILRKNKDGTQVTDGDKGHLPSIPVMAEHDSLMLFLDVAAKQGTKREAFVSTLCRIVEHGLDRIEAWQGKGNPSEGLDNTLKGAFQKCEDRYFEQFMDAKHPEHRLFVGRLPTTDSRNKPLEIAGKLNRDKQFEAFMTLTRKESTYAFLKNLVLSMFSYVGQLPYDDDGNIIPPEVMRVMVDKARIIVPQDNSFRAKLAVLHRVLTADSTEAPKPEGDDLPTIVAMLESMLEVAKADEAAEATRVLARVKPGDVKQASDDAITAAQASTGRTKPQVRVPATT